MKYTIKKLPHSLVEINLSVPYADLDKAKNEAARILSASVKVPGFRHGKVPLQVLERHIGAAPIVDKALDILIQEKYVEVVKKENLEVVDRPEQVEVKKYPEKEGEDIQFEIKVPVLPEVQLGDYKKMKVKKDRVAISEKEIDDVIENLRERLAEYKPVDRPAVNGDRLEIDFAGTTLDGVAIDGASSKHHPLILGSKAFIPGFEEELIGLTRDATKEFTVTFPKDYGQASLAGQPVKFAIKVHEVEEVLKPEVNEEFVERVRGQKMTMIAFRDQVREELKKEKDIEVTRQHEEKIIDELIKLSKIDLPESLIRQELEVVVEELKQRLEMQGGKWEDWLAHSGKTEDEWKKNWTGAAERRVRARLILSEIVKQEKIVVSEDELEAEIGKILARYQSREHIEKVKSLYVKGGRQYRELEARIKVDKVFAMLRQEPKEE